MISRRVREALDREDLTDLEGIQTWYEDPPWLSGSMDPSGAEEDSKIGASRRDKIETLMSRSLAARADCLRLWSSRTRSFDHKDIDVRSVEPSDGFSHAVYLYDDEMLTGWMVIDLDCRSASVRDKTQVILDTYVLVQVLEYLDLPYIVDSSDTGGVHVYVPLRWSDYHRDDLRPILKVLGRALPTMDRSVMSGSRASIRPPGSTVKSGKGRQMLVTHPMMARSLVKCKDGSHGLLCLASHSVGAECDLKDLPTRNEVLDALVAMWSHGLPRACQPGVKNLDNPGTPGGAEPLPPTRACRVSREEDLVVLGMQSIEDALGTEMNVSTVPKLMDRATVSALSGKDASLIPDDLIVRYRRNGTFFAGVGRGIDVTVEEMLRTGRHDRMNRYQGDDSRARMACLAYLHLEGMDPVRMLQEGDPLIQGYCNLVLNGNHGDDVLGKMKHDLQALSNLDSKGSSRTTDPVSIPNTSTPYALAWARAALDGGRATPARTLLIEGIVRVAALNDIHEPGDRMRMSYRHAARHSGLKTSTAEYHLRILAQDGFLELIGYGEDEESLWSLQGVTSGEMIDDPGPLNPIWSAHGPLGSRGGTGMVIYRSLTENPDPVAAISRNTGISRPTIASTLDQMQDIGLAVRGPSGWVRGSMWDVPQDMIDESWDELDSYADITMSESDAYQASRASISDMSEGQKAAFFISQRGDDTNEGIERRHYRMRTRLLERIRRTCSRRHVFVVADRSCRVISRKAFQAHRLRFDLPIDRRGRDP